MKQWVHHIQILHAIRINTKTYCFLQMSNVEVRKSILNYSNQNSISVNRVYHSKVSSLNQHGNNDDRLRLKISRQNGVNLTSEPFICVSVSSLPLFLIFLIFYILLLFFLVYFGLLIERWRLKMLTLIFSSRQIFHQY